MTRSLRKMFVIPAIQIFNGPIIKSDVTSVVLLFLSLGFPEVQVMELGRCPAYCNELGQQENAFSCPPKNDTYYNIFCCGSATVKYCCSNLNLQVSYSPNTSCDNGPKMKYDWIIIITIVMTVVIFVLGLAGCVCICHKKCNCKNAVFSETGEAPSFSVELPPDSVVHSSTASDFDPTSPCAFSPPAYDSLPKSPPAYAEIFTISNGCSYNNPSDLTQTSMQLDSTCNSVNQSHTPPEYTSSAHEESLPRGGTDQSLTSSAIDRSSPSQPVAAAVSSNNSAPPIRRAHSAAHRPSMSLAIEMHPLNPLGVAGSRRLSSPVQVRFLPAGIGHSGF